MCIISWMFNRSCLNCVFCPQILISSISAHMSSAKLETNSTGDSNCWKYWSRTTRLSLRSSETRRQCTERGNGIFWKLKSPGAFKSLIRTHHQCKNGGSHMGCKSLWKQPYGEVGCGLSEDCCHIQDRGSEEKSHMCLMLLIHWFRAMGDWNQSGASGWKLSAVKCWLSHVFCTYYSICGHVCMLSSISLSTDVDWRFLRLREELSLSAFTLKIVFLHVFSRIIMKC